MSEAAVCVERLGKRYDIARARPRYDTLRDSLATSTRAAGRRVTSLLRLRSALPSRVESIWALRDVSFEVDPGDVLGVIGDNGAGKSTLLKILSRITEPTTGEAILRGRVSSLLEVGTGFHPELTGRENVYLSGAIMGMRRREIRRKFDEIVAFAEVDRFIDTPVKHYSSGMYLRLAFAVAAHLEPEILIVDEVLAVGDAQFQKKCLGKMQAVSELEGRTVLFVSHNMHAVQRLCNRCLLLQSGTVVSDGTTTDVVAQYLSTGTPAAAAARWIDISGVPRTGTGEARFQALQYRGGSEATAFNPHPDGPLEFLLSIVSDAPRVIGNLAVTLYDGNGTKLVNADSLVLGSSLALRQGNNLLRLRIEALHLNPGVYLLGLWLTGRGGLVLDFTDCALGLEVVERDPAMLTRPDGDGAVPCRFTISEATDRGEGPAG